MPPACQNELAVGPADKNPPFPEKRGISLQFCSSLYAGQCLQLRYCGRTSSVPAASLRDTFPKGEGIG